MIHIRFAPMGDGRFRRDLTCAEGQDPVCEEVLIPASVYPRWAEPFATDLHDRSVEDLAVLGQQIYDLALATEGREAHEVQRRAGPLTIAIEETPAAFAAAAVPWELMHDGEAYLAIDPRIRLLRIPDDAGRISRIATARPLRVLVCWAAPADQGPIDIEGEQIRLALALAPYRLRGQIVDYEVLRCTRRKLQDALRAQPYDLVYFTGHGTHDEGMGYLCLEDGAGGTECFPATDFARYLGLQERPPALLVLNCCLSAAAGEAMPARGRFLDMGRRALAAGVPFVIATLTPVFVASAQRFAEALLEGLLHDFDVPKAVASARGAVLEAQDGALALRQSFFQFLLLTAAPYGLAHEHIETPPQAQARPDRVHYTSLEYRPPAWTDVRRNDLLLAVEGLYRAGERAAGIYGLGGLGKTVASGQVLEHFGRHPDPGVRAERALWIDLRADPSAAGILTQLCDILGAAGDPKRARALREEARPAPVPLAQALRATFGEDVLVVLDNCESLLDTGGAFADDYARDLVTALVCHTGWRSLLTSRERLDVSRAGREPCPIHWFRIEELGYGERAALLRIGLARSALRDRRLTGEEIELVMREVAGHPYELNLFLRNAARDLDIAGAIRAVHRQTEEYATLAYYVGRAGAEERQMLELLAGLDAAEHEDLIIQVWRALGPARGWSADPGIPARALRSLARQGLVEAQDDHVHILPVLRAYLSEPGPGGTGAELLRRDLARFFFALAGGIEAQANDRLRSGTAGEEQDRSASFLSRQHIEYLHRAARQALAQNDLALAAELLEALCHRAAGRIPALRIAGFARGFEAKLGRLADPAEQKAVIGTCHHVIGTAFLVLRRWPEALENYGKAIAWNDKTGRHHALGNTYHQIGIVYEEQRRWPEALENYGKAIEWKDKTGRHELGMTYHHVGRVHEEQRRWPEALEHYGKAIEWQEKTGQHHQLGITYHHVGMVYQEQRRWPEALENYGKAIECFSKTGRRYELGGTYLQVGKVYQLQRRWPEALENCGKAIEWHKKTGQHHEIGRTYHQVGRVYEEQHRWPEALENYGKAIEWQDKTGQHHEIGTAYHQVGIVYQLQRRWPEALENYGKAIEWKDKTGRHHEIGMTYHQVGMVYEEQRRWSEALETYGKAIEWQGKTGQHHQLGCTYHQVGWVYEEQGDGERAADWYARALETLLEHDPDNLEIALCSAARVAGTVASESEAMRKLRALLLSLSGGAGTAGSGTGEKRSLLDRLRGLFARRPGTR